MTPDSTPSTGYVEAETTACPALHGEQWCIKPLYRARSGEVWPHAGGHFFVTDQAARRLRSGDYDGRAVLESLHPVAKEAIVYAG